MEGLANGNKTDDHYSRCLLKMDQLETAATYKLLFSYMVL